jgi:hypothetical protein
MITKKVCSKAGDGEIKEEVPEGLGCGYVIKHSDKVKPRDCG